MIQRDCAIVYNINETVEGAYKFVKDYLAAVLCFNL